MHYAQGAQGLVRRPTQLAHISALASSREQSLQYADDSLKKDRDIVFEAVKQNGLSLQYADDALKKDSDIVIDLSSSKLI